LRARLQPGGPTLARAKALARTCDDSASFEVALRRFAATAHPLTFDGPPGVGKGLAAARAHDMSPRARGPFVVINCAAIAHELFEAALFGHAAGAFSGAGSARGGVVDEAKGGTLLCDEVGELAPHHQAKLLRAVQEGLVRPVGGVEHAIDVRWMFATNRSLHAEVAAGRFRRDLFDRIWVLHVEVPRLARRQAELPGLARRLLAKVDEGRALSDDALALFARYAWPGNVRELESVLVRVVAMTDEAVVDAAAILRHGELDRAHLARERREPVEGDASDGGGDATGEDVWDRVLEEARASGVSAPDVAERELYRRALEQAEGNVTRAAELLGVDRHRVCRRLDELGWPRARRKKRR
jgi:DNA-binding NtrC family response regulator